MQGEGQLRNLIVNVIYHPQKPTDLNYNKAAYSSPQYA